MFVGTSDRIGAGLASIYVHLKTLSRNLPFRQSQAYGSPSWSRYDTNHADSIESISLSVQCPQSGHVLPSLYRPKLEDSFEAKFHHSPLIAWLGP